MFCLILEQNKQHQRLLSVSDSVKEKPFNEYWSVLSQLFVLMISESNFSPPHQSARRPSC